ncbi:hypothetical protein ACFL0T_01680 [Candidatus Omnitrophota bacterium]
MKLLRIIFVNNFAIKVISLILAVLTWSYIGGQLYRESLPKDKEAPSIIKVSGEKFIVKTLPIYVNIEGEPAKGYRIALDKISIHPSSSVIAGPPKEIEGLTYLSTDPLVVSGKNSSIRENVELTPVPNCKIGYEGRIRITVPITRIKRR